MKKDIFGFSITTRDAITIVTITVAVVLWCVNTFERRDDAVSSKAQLDRRIDGVDVKVETMRASLDGVAKDVSYIRGRLEPKQ